MQLLMTRKLRLSAGVEKDQSRHSEGASKIPISDLLSGRDYHFPANTLFSL